MFGNSFKALSRYVLKSCIVNRKINNRKRMFNLSYRLFLICSNLQENLVLYQNHRHNF